jgi:predicted aspartyl protease
MDVSFNPDEGLIIVPAELFGPAGSAVLRLALDTGATSTVINVAVLVAIGCDPAVAQERVQVTTGSGVEYAARIDLEKLVALGCEVPAFTVLAQTLPPSAGVDGLLGLDFLRGRRLTIDLQAGVVTVS